MAYSYVSLPDMKAELKISDTSDDIPLRAALEDASEVVDKDTGHSFQVSLGTRYVQLDGAGRLIIPDLLAVTTLKTDDSGDQTYATTWAVTDYNLLPTGAPAFHAAYWEVGRRPYGTYYFPTGPLGVEIVGKWGYWEDLFASGTLGAAIISLTATTVTMTAGHSVQALQTLIVDAEQMYVTAVSTNTLTVERNVNGTTAATHLISAPVSVYRYPRSIVRATKIEALRLFRRSEAAFGVIGSDATGVQFRIGRDADYRSLIGPYSEARIA